MIPWWSLLFVLPSAAVLGLLVGLSLAARDLGRLRAQENAMLRRRHSVAVQLLDAEQYRIYSESINMQAAA